MQTATGLCRALYPFCQREVPGNILQDFLRKTEQLHILQWNGDIYSVNSASFAII